MTTATELTATFPADSTAGSVHITAGPDDGYRAQVHGWAVTAQLRPTDRAQLITVRDELEGRVRAKAVAPGSVRFGARLMLDLLGQVARTQGVRLYPYAGSEFYQVLDEEPEVAHRRPWAVFDLRGLVKRHGTKALAEQSRGAGEWVGYSPFPVPLFTPAAFR
jgi:hypothetical protein